MKRFAAVLALLLSPFFVTATYSAEDTPHFEVVSEYIRSLGAVHNIQKIAKKENEQDKEPVAKLMSAIRSSTRMKLELTASISALKAMRLKEPFENVLPNTINAYESKIELHDHLIKIAETLLGGPKPGVNFSELAAVMPKITATMEYIDESIFQSMVLVFALLIDEKPDSQGHMSHLNISKAQRQKLISNIDSYFGQSLNKKDKNWTVSAAALLKAYLQKNYKCTDEW